MKNSEKRTNQLSRMFEILGMINSGKQCTRSGLSEYFEVSERTISRDLRLMSALFPIYYDTETGTYSFAGDYSFKDVNLSPDEIRALHMCRLIASNLGEPVSGPIDSLMKKLKVGMGKKSGRMLEKASASYAFDIAPTEQVTALQKCFDVIQHALDENVSLEITHRQEALKEVETIDPYGLFTRIGRFYLIGYSLEKKDIRVFAIHRIRNIKRTNIPYSLPPGFSTDNFLRDRKEVIYREDIEGLTSALEWLDTAIHLFSMRRGTLIIDSFATSYRLLISHFRKAIAEALDEVNKMWPDSQNFERESIVIRSLEKEMKEEERIKYAFEAYVERLSLEQYDKSIENHFAILETMAFNMEMREFLKAYDHVTLQKKKDRLEEELERLKAMIADGAGMAVEQNETITGGAV